MTLIILACCRNAVNRRW